MTCLFNEAKTHLILIMLIHYIRQRIGLKIKNTELTHMFNQIRHGLED